MNFGHDSRQCKTRFLIQREIVTNSINVCNERFLNIRSEIYWHICNLKLNYMYQFNIVKYVYRYLINPIRRGSIKNLLSYCPHSSRFLAGFAQRKGSHGRPQRPPFRMNSERGVAWKLRPLHPMRHHADEWKRKVRKRLTTQSKEDEGVAVVCWGTNLNFS